ncbi:MAG: helix-turn-helix domain-containing protein [Chitinophagaceae bacterium]
MIEIEYSNSDYISFIKTVAKTFNVSSNGNFLAVPPKYGSGYFHAENLSNGISVLMMDRILKEEIEHKISNTNQIFILQFNEFFSQNTNINKTKENTQQTDIYRNMVLLTNSVMTPKFIVPKDVRIRSIKLIFTKEHLLQFFDNNLIDVLISSYFSELLKNKKNEPVDAEYRSLMNELIIEKINHPLQLHFIQNRIMLLLERFIIKCLQKIQPDKTTLKLSDDEIFRLMKIESLLIKDFSISPPNIGMLSRISAMSPTKLKKDFKALYGLPIYEYFQKNRMLHAKSLLLEKKYSIKEVGNKVGYTNLGHFAASFKKEFNVLPRHFSNDGDALELTENFLLDPV